MYLPVGTEACDLSAPSSWLVGTLHSCYGRFMRMDHSKELNRAWAGSLILGAGAAEIVKQNKWMNNPSNEQRAEAGHRDHLSTALTRRRRRRGSAAYTPCWSRDTKRLITIWKCKQIKESSHTRKYKTCAHRGHITFVPRTFPSGNNATALFSPHLWLYSLLFFLFCPEKQRLLSS